MRLRERLSLLGDGPRDAPGGSARSRPRSAGATTCCAGEQARLRRLAVFPGSFDAAAAEAVADEAGAVVPALARLVDASLLAADPPRYRLLMTVRAFARERLREAGEQEATAARHRDAYLALAEQVGRNMPGPGLGAWLPRGRLEHENFQAALRWSLDRGDGGPRSAWPRGCRSTGSARDSSATAAS